MPKRAREIARHDAAGLDDQIGGEQRAAPRAAADGWSPARPRARGDHSIITGCAAFPGRFAGELAEKFGVARLGKAGAVEHVLGDRIGDDRRRACRRARRATARRMEAIAAGALDASGLPGRGGDWQARAARPAARVENAAAACVRRRPRRSAHRGRAAARAREENPDRRSGRTAAGRARRGAARCASVMSGPMPAGSPSVRRQRTAPARLRSFVFDHRRFAQFFQIFLGLAPRTACEKSCRAFLA